MRLILTTAAVLLGLSSVATPAAAAATVPGSPAADASAATGAPGAIHYLPILTTAVSVAFLIVLVRRAVPRRWPPHLSWWAIGVFFYGLGTLLESMITVGGNTPTLNRLWYWAGAILGGYPLATGTVYLLLRRGVAHALTFTSLALVVFASAAVLVSPLNLENLQPEKPGGDVIGWQWVRLLTPIINGYAALFLVGGALYSAFRFARTPGPGNGARALGTGLIALGGLLPGIGGGMAKAGVVEALYVGELAGLVLIWLGYERCVRGPAPALAAGSADDARPASQPDAPAAGAS